MWIAFLASWVQLGNLTGAPFFRAMLDYLGQALAADQVFLGDLDSGSHVETVASWKDRQAEPHGRLHGGGHAD